MLTLLPSSREHQKSGETLGQATWGLQALSFILDVAGPEPDSPSSSRSRSAFSRKLPAMATPQRIHDFLQWPPYALDFHGGVSNLSLCSFTLCPHPRLYRKLSSSSTRSLCTRGVSSTRSSLPRRRPKWPLPLGLSLRFRFLYVHYAGCCTGYYTGTTRPIREAPECLFARKDPGGASFAYSHTQTYVSNIYLNVAWKIVLTSTAVEGSLCG